MKAAIYRSFGGIISVEDDIPIPRISSKDGVLIEVRATGVCRSDWHGWKGHDDDIKKHGLPFIPGHEFSGIIVRSTCPSLQVGDRVAVPFILSCGTCHSCCIDMKPTVCHNQRQPGFTQWGSFAQYVSIPRASRNVRKLPQNVSFIQAAALGCRLSTAYRAIIQQGQLQSHHSLVVAGCGGVGLSCIIIAKNEISPTKIIAIDVSKAALIKARDVGATHTILLDTSSNTKNIKMGTTTTASNFANNNNDSSSIVSFTTKEDVIKEVWEITHNQGAHVSVDAAGFATTCEMAIACTRRAGRMVQVGLPIDGKALPQVPMGLIAGRELEIIGSHGFSADDLSSLLQLVSSGKLNPMKLVERCVTLEEGAQVLMSMDTTSPLGMTIITDFNNKKNKNGNDETTTNNNDFHRSKI